MPGMTLAKWMEANGLSLSEFAKLLRQQGVTVTKQAVHSWVSGSSMPRRPVLHAIAKVTGKSVQPNDFVRAA